MAVVKKKRAKKERHQQVAREFQMFMERHPNATQRRQVKTFDAICDAVSAPTTKNKFQTGGQVEIFDELESSRSSSR